MKKLVLSLLVIFSIIFLSTCNYDNTLIKLPNCPTCADNVSWDGYGEWRFREVGYDGSNGSSLNIEMDCGWRIYENNEGGIGETYQVYSCDTGVIFIWRWSNLGAVVLGKGWEGSTTEGIRIGDSMSKFLSTYDYFEPYEGDSTVLKYSFDDDGEVKRYILATFSEDKKLKYLYIQKGN